MDEDSVNIGDLKRKYTQEDEIEPQRRKKDEKVKKEKKRKREKSNKEKKKKKSHKEHKKDHSKEHKKKKVSSSSSDSESDSSDDAPRNCITGKRIKMYREVTAQDKLNEIERSALRHFMNAQS